MATPAAPARTRWVAVALIGAVAALTALLALPLAREQAVRAAGASLFDGGRPLVAHIGGQVDPMPDHALRCVNCHADAATATPPGSAASAAGFAPTLTARHLTTVQPRRGGPASRYEPATFCRLLRTGVDPALVQITRAMPRYTISDADCAALWAHLTR